MTSVAVLPIFGDLPSRVQTFQPSADDDTAVLETLTRMEAIVRRTMRDALVRGAAHQAAGRLPASASDRELASAVWRWVRSRVRFVQDEEMAPGAREVLIEPPRMLTMPNPEGDCDDFSMLSAAMCLALGVPVQFVAVAADRRDPSRYSHVYLRAVLEDGAPFAIDASHGQYPGWEVPQVFRRLPWRVIWPETGAVSGLEGIATRSVAGSASLLYSAGLVAAAVLALMAMPEVLR